MIITLCMIFLTTLRSSTTSDTKKLKISNVNNINTCKLSIHVFSCFVRYVLRNFQNNIAHCGTLTQLYQLPIVKLSLNFAKETPYCNIFYTNFFGTK